MKLYSRNALAQRLPEKKRTLSYFIKTVKKETTVFLTISLLPSNCRTAHIIELNTAEPRSYGFQGTNNFILLQADFCYCQQRKKRKLSFRDYEFLSVIGGILLVAGPLERGSTVAELSTNCQCLHRLRIGL